MTQVGFTSRKKVGNTMVPQTLDWSIAADEGLKDCCS
jgi:hypothetical protein